MENKQFAAKKQEIPKIKRFIKDYCKELNLEKDTYDWIMKQAEEVVGINIIMECFSTANNVIGDVGCTLLVAKSENYFDKNKYNSRASQRES